MRIAVIFLLMVLGGWPPLLAEDADVPVHGEMLRAAVSRSEDMQPARSHRLRWIDGALYTSVLAYRTMDFFSTQPCLHSRYCSESELPQAVVATKAGFAAFEAGMAASEIGSSWWLHRHGHTKLARAMDAFSVSTGTWTVVHNYSIRKYD